MPGSNLYRIGAAFALGALAPVAVMAQAAPEPAPGQWQFAASIYAYLPAIGGTSRFPVDSGGTPINITAKQIIDSLKFVAMGSLEANNGTWGGFTDLVYVDMGASKSASHDFTIGNVGLPVGTTADLSLDVKGLVWTTAATYRVMKDPAWTVDLLGGVRMFDMRESLAYTISGSVGPIDPAARSGNVTVNSRIWDGIIGVKGRYRFGAEREWAVPFYFDVGTGDHTNTVQAAGGISYAFHWGELNALWRYLGYHATGNEAVQSINFNGPQVGAVFRW